MLRRWLTFAAAVAAACWSAPSRAELPNWPDAIVLATASEGGTYDVYGEGLARLLTRTLNISVGTRRTGGPAENIELLERGEVQLAFVTMGVAMHAWEGSGAWNGRPMRSMRALFPMYDTPFHFVTLQAAGIGRIADMAGRRIGIGPAGGTGDTYVPSFLSTLGIAASTVNGAWIDLARQLEDGGIEVLAVAAGVPFPAVVDIEPRRKVAYIAPTAEQAMALRLAWPELTASVIPPGTYPSLDRPYPTVGLFNFAIARADMPEDLAYRIVETVFSHHQEMLDIHSAAAATVAGNFARNTFLPFHPGASRYYGNISARGVVQGD